jgi:integrase/recombinase XerC
MSQPSVHQSMEAYLRSVHSARSANTARTYSNALRAFVSTLEERGLDLESTPARHAEEDWIARFAKDLKRYAPATESLYLTAAAGWYEYLAAENLADINLPRMRLLIRHRSRRPGIRLPQFPRRAIEQMIDYAERLSRRPVDGRRERLRNLRDRAFIITLADTGLRVHEACELRRGDVDWNEGQAVLIGKGDRQAVVRFSNRAMGCLKDYLSSRSRLDGASRRPLATLPLFARHDRGAGSKVLPISTTTGRAIVNQRGEEALGQKEANAITPHSFRHYFVTSALRGSGGNLKLAQELARHKNISVTQRYAHLSDDELDRAYHEIFNQG